jgi:hypothetical protein
MCLICAELSKNTLTVEEARRNLGEMYTDMTKDHVREILQLIWQKEDEQYESIKDEGSD